MAQQYNAPKKKYDFHISYQATSSKEGKIFVFDTIVTSTERKWTKQSIASLKEKIKDNLNGPVEKMTIICITPLKASRNTSPEITFGA